MRERNGDVFDHFKDLLMGIQTQMSRIQEDPQFGDLVRAITRPPIHPSGGVMCMFQDDLHVLDDFAASLNSMHQWIGSIIEVLETK